VSIFLFIYPSLANIRHSASLITATHPHTTPYPLYLLYPHPQEVGRRRLRNTVLDYLSSDKDSVAALRSKKHFDTADCMTDRMAGLMTLASMGESCGAVCVALGRYSYSTSSSAEQFFLCQFLSLSPYLTPSISLPPCLSHYLPPSLSHTP
jgi:Domain of unknown function (DUF3458_C) ARM repeats